MRERALSAIQSKEQRMSDTATDIKKDVHRTLISTKEFLPETKNSIRLEQLLYTTAVLILKILKILNSS